MVDRCQRGRRMARRKGRRLDGILLLDKPRGLSSNAALQRVKHLFQARKAGHTGSLDPLASGLLPICLGEATKVSGFLLDADKRYWVKARLGVQTTTGDAEGEPVRECPVEAVSAEGLQRILPQFLGDHDQVPPMYSAVKHQGKRLYELARAGLEVERQPRRICIHALQMVGFGDGYMALDMRCSKGTYVRTLVEDMANAAGGCAHVVELRRLSVGPFQAHHLHTMEELEALAAEDLQALDKTLLPAGAALEHRPAVTLDQDSAFYVSRGQPVLVPRAPTQGWVRIYDHQARLLGVGEVLGDGRIAPRRLFRG